MGHNIEVRGTRRRRFWVYALVFGVSLAGVVAADIGLNEATQKLSGHDQALHTITEDFNNIRSQASVLHEVLEDYPEGKWQVGDLRRSYQAVMVEMSVASDDVEALSEPGAMQSLHSIMLELGGVDRLIQALEAGSPVAQDEFRDAADDLLAGVSGMADGTALVVLREGFAEHFSPALRVMLVSLPLMSLIALVAMGYEMNREATRAHAQTRARLGDEDRKRKLAETLASGQADAMELLASGEPIEVVERALARLVSAQTDQSWALIERKLEPVSETSDEISPGLVATVERVLHLASDRDGATAALTFEATHDGLTQLRNRSSFVSEVEKLMAPDGSHDALTVFYLDFDNFKVINDTYGQVVGDQVLTAMAERLVSVVGGTNLVARVGGDKFAVAVHPVTSEPARALAHRLWDRLCQPCSINGYEIKLEASMGVSFAGSTDSDPDRLLREADSAMYYAKRTSDKIVFVDDTLRALEERHHEIEVRIGEAVHDGGLVALYQPLVELSTGRIRGVEALARLRLGDEILAPASFIGIAEETGQIVELDRTIMEIAARQVSEWNAKYGLKLELAVNLSGVHANRRDALVDIHTILRHAGLGAESLVVEINEGVFLTDTEAVADRLSVLRDLGVRISIDDFGTGYSSLAYLQNLPIDVLKIDRSFVSRIGESPRGEALVRAVVSLAMALDLEVVAEGIEQVEQMEFISSLGCHLGQGYFFDRPCDAATIEDHWLVHERPLESAFRA